MTMPTVLEMDVLREVARTALGKAKNQAPEFEHVLLTLTGAVATYHEPGTLKPGIREGHHLGSCWFDLKGVTYFLSFSKDAGHIRHGGRQGPVDFEVDETTAGQDVLQWFESKSPVPALS